MPRWRSLSADMKSQDFKRLVEMLVHFKVTLDLGARSSYAISDFGFFRLWEEWSWIPMKI